ncbi:MAG: hypothetical protein FWD73_00410 [Polyangiaceae bacterium]|nr:hypothetical protein [Polyangiaceae bacterium]
MATEGIATRPRDPFNLNQAEEGDPKAVSTVKKEAGAATSKAKEAIPSVAHWPEPSQALDDQYSADVAEFVKNSTANAKPAAAPLAATGAMAKGVSHAGVVAAIAHTVIVHPTGLGEGIDKLAAKSPSLQKDLWQLKKDGWHIQYGPKGGGCETRNNKKLITIDEDLKNDPTAATEALAHEVGHATYPKVLAREASEGGHATCTESSNYGSCSKKTYVKSMLADEGAATMNNIKAQREIKENGGPDIGISGNQANHAAYNAAYDKYLLNGDAEAARNAIGAKYGEGETTSTTGQTYNKYYGNGYDQVCSP